MPSVPCFAHRGQMHKPPLPQNFSAFFFIKIWLFQKRAIILQCTIILIHQYAQHLKPNVRLQTTPPHSRQHQPVDAAGWDLRVARSQRCRKVNPALSHRRSVDPTERNGSLQRQRYPSPFARNPWRHLPCQRGVLASIDFLQTLCEIERTSLPALLPRNASAEP